MLMFPSISIGGPIEAYLIDTRLGLVPMFPSISIGGPIEALTAAQAVTVRQHVSVDFDRRPH